MSDERISLRVPEPPPPSERLRGLIAAGEPVPISGRSRELVLASAFSVACAGVAALGIGLRADLTGLPAAAMIAATIVWALAGAIALAAATRPPRGQVLPSVSRARALALGLPVVCAVAATALLVEAPGLTRQPVEPLGPILHCLGCGTLIALAPFSFVLLRARRRLLVGAGWMGAIVGVAAGTIGALVLHLVCSTGGRTHLLGGHVMVVVIAGGAGAVFAQLLRRR